MALKNFIKENFVLAVGITLPVLLIALFFVASVLPRSMATPPQYEMVFSTLPYNNYQNKRSYTVNFAVKDNVLKARVYKNKKENANSYNPNPKLWVYDGKTKNVREIPYDFETVNDGEEVIVDGLKNAKIDSAKKAPDGYEFENAGHRSGSLATEMFGGNYNTTARVIKGAVAFKIPLEKRNRYGIYGDMQFLGWIIGQK